MAVVVAMVAVAVVAVVVVAMVVAVVAVGVGGGDVRRRDDGHARELAQQQIGKGRGAQAVVQRRDEILVEHDRRKGGGHRQAVVRGIVRRREHHEEKPNGRAVLTASLDGGGEAHKRHHGRAHPVDRRHKQLESLLVRIGR